MPELALVADIGATNARFALIAPGGRDIVAPLVMPCADFPGLAEAAQAYLGRAKPAARPKLAAFDVAGPVTGNVVELTNHPWRIVIPDVRSRLALDGLEVVNDFDALSRAIPLLGAGDRETIRPGKAGPPGPIAVIGPGTGLGVGAVIPDSAGKWVPIASEGGHVTLAAADDREDEILRHLRRRFGHVSAERVLSGPGLVNLYEAVCAVSGAKAEPLTPEQFAERALAGEARPKETLDLFFAMLGTVAGNLALTVGARGGVAIAGGIVPRYLALIRDSAFETRFLEKGRMRTYLAEMQVYVVTHPLPAFLGLAGLLGEIASGARRRAPATV